MMPPKKVIEKFTLVVHSDIPRGWRNWWFSGIYPLGGSHAVINTPLWLVLLTVSNFTGRIRSPHAIRYTKYRATKHVLQLRRAPTQSSHIMDCRLQRAIIQINMSFYFMTVKFTWPDVHTQSIAERDLKDNPNLGRELTCTLSQVLSCTGVY